MGDPAADRAGGTLGDVPRTSVDTLGRTAAALALATVLLAACSQSRPVTITSPCDTDVLVDWLYRSQGGSDVVTEDYVIEAGEHVYSDAVETEYIALTVDGRILAETSLPADKLDDEGANAFPPMAIPAEACSELTPATDDGSGTGGY